MRRHARRGLVRARMIGKRMLTVIGLLCVATASSAYLIRIRSTDLVHNQRALDLVVCIDEKDRASWNAGVETASFLDRTMTRACMAARGYLLIQDGQVLCSSGTPIVTPQMAGCYWRPRASIWDFLRD